MTELIVALVTLTFLEIVLGVDNVIFIAILSAKLPPSQQKAARRWGLAGAMITRVLLLLSIKWIAGLTTPFMTIAGFPIPSFDYAIRYVGHHFGVHQGSTVMIKKFV